MNWDKGIWFYVFLLVFLPTGFLFAADADVDGLSDDVELQLGSNPNHKDIFVEVDWLVVNGRSFRPRGNFIQMAKEFFASADTFNPDKGDGITIHIQLSQGIKINQETIGSFDPDGNYNWSDFDAIKSQYFTPSRRSTHHYCLFVSDIGGVNGSPTGISGISRNVCCAVQDFRKGASYFIVALGGPWYNYPTAGLYRWTQFGTFVHELGHNMGLVHGGHDHISYKPNNFSVMSYCYQTGGVPITASDGKKYYLYDYGRFIMYAALNENALNETTGLTYFGGHTGTTRYGARWWFGDGQEDFHESFDSSKNIDWNQNGRLETNLRMNLNPLFDLKFTSYGGTTLEWPIMSFDGGQIGKAGLSEQAVLPSSTFMKCLSFKESKHSQVKLNSNIPRVTYSKFK